MPPNEPRPHCGELILDWHNEWYNAEVRAAIYRGQAAMDCPQCRQPVLWLHSRELESAAAATMPVHFRSLIIASQWTRVREPMFGDLAGYLKGHSAGQQYRGYWSDAEVQEAGQKADTQ